MMHVIILIITIIFMMMNKTWSIILCSNWASKPGPEGSEGSEGAPRATARRPSQLWSQWAWWHFWSQWEQWDHYYEAVAGNDDGFDEILNFLWWILLVAKQKIVRSLIPFLIHLLNFPLRVSMVYNKVDDLILFSFWYISIPRRIMANCFDRNDSPYITSLVSSLL